MKIDEKYSSKIMELTQKTQVAIRKLGFDQYNINLLTKEKQLLLSALQSYSKQKQQVISEISQQYGQGYLNPQTWQFTTKDQ